MKKRKNILFIVMDQFRADCLFGDLGRHVELPALRGLMSEGVSFEKHFSVSTPCGPARASLLTGQYAMNHRSVRNGTPLPHDSPNLALEMRKAGYLPLLFGYTDTSQDPRLFDTNDPAMFSYEQVMPGFVEVLEMREGESWPWRAHLAAKGYDVLPGLDVYKPAGKRPDDPAIYAAEDSDTAFLADSVIGEIKARPQGWFMHVCFFRPHPPLVAPEPYNRLVAPTSLPKPIPACPDTHRFDEITRRTKPMSGHVQGFPDLEESEENVAMLRALYLGLAAEVDHHIGRIVDALKENGQYEDTLIVVTGDHGEMLGDYGLWGKTAYHDAAYHIPLIIRHPDYRQKAGSKIAAFTESVDVAPTLLPLTDLKSPDAMDGESLVPFLEGDTPAGWRSHSFSEVDFGDPSDATAWQAELDLDCDQANAAILRDARYMLVHFNGGLPPLLFERSGTGQLRDISHDPAATPVLLEMSRKMLDHRMTHPNGRFSHTMITAKGIFMR